MPEKTRGRSAIIFHCPRKGPSGRAGYCAPAGGGQGGAVERSPMTANAVDDSASRVEWGNQPAHSAVHFGQGVDFVHALRTLPENRDAPMAETADRPTLPTHGAATL